MKTPSRYLLILVSATVLILLAGLVVFQNVSRRSILKSTQFNAQYSGVIQQLRTQVDSAQKKMKRNAVTIPVFVIASVSESVPAQAPAPVQQAFVKDRSFVLQGISWNADRPVVMIEDQIYRTGDKIGEFTIQRILRQSIVLRDADGALREIALHREEQP